MKYHLFFSDPIAVTIPDESLQKMTRNLEKKGKLQLFRNPLIPEIWDSSHWGLDVTNFGQRTLRLAEFSRDMFWEKEVDEVYETLVSQGKELALIEDLLAVMDEPAHSQLPRDLNVLCLGSPIILDLEPLFLSISTRTIINFLQFTPYEGCYSSAGSRVLVADITGEPSPRSSHFPFPRD